MIVEDPYFTEKLKFAESPAFSFLSRGISNLSSNSRRNVVQVLYFQF
jgi:hypothetical protein